MKPSSVPYKKITEFQQQEIHIEVYLLLPQNDFLFRVHVANEKNIDDIIIENKDFSRISSDSGSSAKAVEYICKEIFCRYLPPKELEKHKKNLEALLQNDDSIEKWLHKKARSLQNILEKKK